jgi:hypothetical protein
MGAAFDYGLGIIVASGTLLLTEKVSQFLGNMIRVGMESLLAIVPMTIET